MKVLTLTNEKGGVGKTTLALHIAAGLALKDLRVLLIDADAQAHCGHQLAVPEFGGLYRLLVQEAEWKDVLREPDATHWAGSGPTIGRLLLLPSNVETRVIPMVISDPLLLRERLRELESAIDVVVIDTSPTPSLLHSVIYCASDFALYPTKCEMLSLDGIAKSSLHMKQQDEARRVYGLDPVKLLGVMPTMYRDTNSHIYGRNLLEQHFGEALIWQPLPQRTVWTDREYEKKTLYAFAPNHVATREVRAIVRKVTKYVA